MRKLIINSIKLNNIGSYQGEVYFNLNPDDKRNVTIIGGKNGAGKTTLFTAIRIAIYGHSAFGYEVQGSHYSREIKKLINNKSKREQDTKASIELSVSINNGINSDMYLLIRTWNFKKNKAVNHEFNVIKNDIVLNKDEVQDFEKYILNIIPPSLFNLYFFDGEKIADFFFKNGSTRNIKEAIFTLCGYDNFEIMRRNFIRLNKIKKNEKIFADYIDISDKKNSIETNLEEATEILNGLQLELQDTDEKIKIKDNEYQKNGGVTQKEWQIKFDDLKTEEKIREDINLKLKKYANDVLPFLMIKSQIEQIKQQVKLEEDVSMTKGFVKLLKKEDISELFLKEFSHNKNNIDSEIVNNVIKNVASAVESEINDEIILKFSFDEKINVMNKVNDILAFDIDEIKNDIKSRKKSLKRSKKIRKDIDNCNIDNIHEYVEIKNKLILEKDNIIKQISIAEKNVLNYENDYEVVTSKFEIIKRKYEKEIKENSIKSIAGKGLLLIEQLQERLIKIELKNVEKLFMKEFRLLTHKNNFIDDMYFDSNYNVKICRNEIMSQSEINKLVEMSNDEILNEFGEKALDAIILVPENEIKEGLVIPVEIDKTTFSNGEKQIYIMSLYKALMELSRHKVPFVIDTPFARIDKEHRLNITEHFFKELNGQVFILSTDEEITEEHLEVLKDNINSKFILENNGDENRTIVLENNYFEGDSNAV